MQSFVSSCNHWIPVFTGMTAIGQLRGGYSNAKTPGYIPGGCSGIAIGKGIGFSKNFDFDPDSDFDGGPCSVMAAS